MIETQVRSGPGPDASSGPPLFEARALSKRFDDIVACDAISLTLRAGEKHALLGENGAGKSTFVKMIDGVLLPDSGSILIDGKPVSIASPIQARRFGIGMVFQHFASFGALTVAENIALSLPGKPMRAIRKAIRETGEAFGLSIAPERRIETLSAGEKQRVEIVRCLLQEPRLLILDEPTSVLTPQEADALFATLDALAASGVGLIYISHRLEEVRALCGTATILRRGKVVATCDPAQETAETLAEMMIGATPPPLEQSLGYIGKARLEVSELSVPSEESVPLRKVSFAARRGEILGIAGVAGEGQSELFAALSGERRTPQHDRIRINGKPVGAFGTTARRRLGAAFAPEQRLGHAAIADLPLTKNLELTRHSLRGASRSAHARTVQAIRESYDVRGAKGDPAAGTLSGGNLQKFVIGRELDRKPEVFVVAQPTWGIDAGAAMTIRNRLIELARSGAAVVAISQDLDEIFQICDRIAVLHRGELSPVFLTEQMTPERIGMLMAGADPETIFSHPQDDASTTAPIVQPAPPASPESEPRLPEATAPRIEEPEPQIAAPAPKPVIKSASMKIEHTEAPAAKPAPVPQPAQEPEPVTFGTVGATITVPWTPPQPTDRVEQKQ